VCLIRRHQLQLLDPDWGGWHTVLTAASAEDLEVSARTLTWQTRSPVRIVDPDGHEVHRIEWEDETPVTTTRAG
jgi:hypothetical protein